jgi:regulator of cell morphogenesis and NO signaling
MEPSTDAPDEIRARKEERMSVTIEKTVRELALEEPGAARVFERLGIDYCCGGAHTLGQACQAAHLQASDVMEELANAENSAQDFPRDSYWQAASLADLMAHIKATHHKYTREEIARLRPLFDKVCSAHGERHIELLELRATFSGLSHELETHLMKEEMVLFPYIERLEEAVIQKEPVVPPPFGSVQNPVSMMESEHALAGTALRKLRAGSNGYTAPADACASYQALYRALAQFEADLHQHIHLENNILFPRAIEMERTN